LEKGQLWKSRTCVRADPKKSQNPSESMKFRLIQRWVKFSAVNALTMEVLTAARSNGIVRSYHMFQYIPDWKAQ
jgi:hypothetical protein